jgi:hypothetical protein
MTFTDDVVSGLAKIYETAGSSALFHPLAGQDQTVNVIVEYSVEWEPSSQIQVADDHIVIQYQRADIDRRVLKGETFTIGADVYEVRSMATYPEAFTEFEGHAVVRLT